MRLKEGEIVTVRERLAPETLQYDEVRIITKQTGFVALCKPAGMLTHPTAREAINTLTAYAQHKGWSEAGIVHRLDRETSGVVVMAKGNPSQRRWAQRFADTQTHKRYLAIVLDPQKIHKVGGISFSDQSLGLDSNSILPTIKVGVGGWSARTDWVCLARRDDLALLCLKITHGRQHQIRAHLSLFGTPVAGDKLYGHGEEFFLDALNGTADLSQLRAPKHTLHAWELCWEEDGVGWGLRADSPLIFEELLQRTIRSCPLQLCDQYLGTPKRDHFFSG